jgi:diguanylate cyclase (GGDEF)-like protein
MRPITVLDGSTAARFRDGLTALPDRRALDRQRPRAAVDSAPSAILCVDLDGFHDVNEVVGYAVGDGVLVEFARRLKQCIRAKDVLVRLGADEFGIYIRAADERQVHQIAERTMVEAERPFHVAGNVVHLGACIGIAMSTDVTPDESLSTMDSLLRHATAALRLAKHEGRGRIRRLTDPTGEEVDGPAATAAIARRIRPALLAGDFSLHYQQLLDIPTMQCHEVEALMRWTDPELGPVGPNRFIPIAEHSAQIVALGRWALYEACEQAKRWLDDGAPRTVGVNVSAYQLTDPQLVADVDEALDLTGVPADMLRMEITESAAVSDICGTVGRLNQLRTLGVHLSLDDFGTGYSSLAMLRQLPISTLKVDRSFVDRLDSPNNYPDAVLIEAVIATAHAYGLTVVAEGIERPAQLALLRNMGCDTAQGFLLHRPQPANEIRWAPSTVRLTTAK